MNVSWFKVFGLIGILAEELSKAASDGKITINEAIVIVARICTSLGIDFDTKGVAVDGLIPGAGSQAVDSVNGA